ncbi:4Fe-4S binding protein [Candidatus Bathyarchaeota archaeon]|nr:4Fe-4S binding protein [Candidatus Bathyarchaeota archaeon]
MKEKEISLELVPGGWVSTPRPAQKTGTWRTLRPVVDVEKCIGCGICESFCPETTIKVVDGKAEVDYEYCKGCGVCANECTSQAIAMELEVEEESEGGGY